MQNGNGYKYLLAIDRANKMIQGSSKALANNTHNIIMLDTFRSVLVHCNLLLLLS